MQYDDFVRKASHAEVLISQGKFQQAEAILKALMATGVDNQDIWRMMIVSWMGMHRYREARDLCLTSLQYYPHDAWTLYSLAHIALAEHRYEESLNYVDEALKLEPESDNFHSLRASVYIHLKDYQQAIISATTALELNPENVDAMNNASTALIGMSKYAEALDLLKTALSIDPENSDIHARLGWTYLQTGDSGVALTHFKSALQKNPLDSYALSGMQEALKARFTIYRYFLVLSLKIEHMRGYQQWTLIVLSFLLYRTLVFLSGHFDFLQIWLSPVLILMVLFFLATWVLSPLMNLYLLSHPFGRWTLDTHQKSSAVWTAMASCISIISFIFYMSFESQGFLHTAFVSFMCMIPLGSMNNPSAHAHRKVLNIFSYVLVISGVVSSTLSFLRNELWHPSVWPFILGMLAYQWYANYLMIRE